MNQNQTPQYNLNISQDELTPLKPKKAPCAFYLIAGAFLFLCLSGLLYLLAKEPASPVSEVLSKEPSKQPSSLAAPQQQVPESKPEARVPEKPVRNEPEQHRIEQSVRSKSEGREPTAEKIALVTPLLKGSVPIQELAITQEKEELGIRLCIPNSPIIDKLASFGDTLTLQAELIQNDSMATPLGPVTFSKDAGGAFCTHIALGKMTDAKTEASFVKLFNIPWAQKTTIVFKSGSETIITAEPKVRWGF